MSEMDPDCEAKGIPPHLHSLGRAADPVFADDELLYRRFPLSVADLTAAIRFNRMSVNRGKYCQSPDDVLWNDQAGGRYSGCGVFSLPVGALKEKWPHPDRENEPYSFTLKPEHRPESCNYPHTEVVAVKAHNDGGEEALENIKPLSVKLKIREALRPHLRLHIRNEQSDKIEEGEID